MIEISIIIVNYNVKDYLYKCIYSIYQSEGINNFEIIIVDNNSNDNSVELIRKEYPEIKLIELNENLGFAKANNIGINQARGKYILLLNPDTLLEKNTLEVMYNFMESNQDVGLSTCKILNGDGSFQEACRRSFPTPFSAFSKLFGLQNIFPNSKIFGKYNLMHLPVDEDYEVEAISGSFMFFRANVLKEVNGFDTDFFMYGEDLDLCYRVKKKGYKIFYYPKTTIIHYKGESTKRSNLNYTKEFYKAMQIYVKKHHSASYFFRFLLFTGILFRLFISYLIKYMKDIFLIIFDLTVLAIGMMIGSKIVFDFYIGFPDYAYPNVFIVPQFTLLFLMIIFGEYFENKYTISGVLYVYTITFLILSTLTYFFPEYRFSRGVVLFMIGFGLFFSATIRLIFLITDKIRGKNKELRIAIVGNNKSFNNLINEFGILDPGKFQFIGYINDYNNEKDTNWLGNLSHLEEIISQKKINNLIITDKNLSNDSVLNKISKLQNKIKIHFVSHFKDFVISKIIYDLIGTNNQVIIIKYNLLRYKILKRILDLIISFLLFIILLPFIFIYPVRMKLKELLNIVIGEKTFIGIYNPNKKLKEYKHGLINFVNVSQINIDDEETINKLNYYYLTNYSLSLDFDLLLRKILGI